MSLTEKIDKGVMYLANKAVHGWNWTTGKGKADLANLLFLLGSGACIGGDVVKKDYHMVEVGGIVLGIGSIAYGLYNKKVERLERDALKREAKSFDAEVYKHILKSVGNFLLCAASGFIAFNLSSHNDLEKNPEAHSLKTGALIFNAGLAMIASSSFVMRADYLPPRKNCLARGWEKAKEIAEKYSQILNPQPQPQPVAASWR